MPYPTPQLVQQFQESTGLLGNAGVLTGSSHDAGNNAQSGAGYSKLRVFANADQAGSYVVQQSRDGSTWYTVGAATAIVANTPLITDFNLALRFIRVVYTNGATPQGVFELDSTLMAI